MPDHTSRLRRQPGWLGLGLLFIALSLSIHYGNSLLGATPWSHALGSGAPDDLPSLLVRYSYLPRVVISLLVGAALALAGVMFQQVLRNPIAEPTTLGVASGAHLALAVCTIYAPGLLDGGQEWVAMVGAGLGMLAVLGLAWGRRLSPVALILSGLIINLYCGTLSTLLVLANHEVLSNLFIWQSGSLNQNSWQDVYHLAPRLAVAAVLAALLARPLQVLGLNDAAAGSLGLSPNRLRLAALAVAVALSASAIASVGVIGFIGLAGPALARLAGARTLRQRLCWAPLLGALLLLLADQVVLGSAALLGGEMPTGIFTAFLGAPLLLVLLTRLQETRLNPPAPRPAMYVAPLQRTGWVLLGVLGVSVFAALTWGRGPDGWYFSTGAEFANLLQWRAPRVAAAFAAGVLLALAGTLMQRMTGNPMASPEMLGVSSGAALGGILALLLVPGFSPLVLLLAAIAGALLALLAIVALSWRSAFAPDRMLLTGVALSTLLNAFAALFMVSGDSRVLLMLSWMTGSTYRIDTAQAVVISALAIGFMPLTALCNRWLAIMPLGVERTRALGISLGGSRLVLLLLTAVMTAAATLVVGPLSFVGLIAPHMARLLGAHRPIAQLLLSALLGGTLLVLADWLGRNLVFPWQIPAGMFATFIGGPYFMWLLARKR